MLHAYGCCFALQLLFVHTQNVLSLVAAFLRKKLASLAFPKKNEIRADQYPPAAAIPSGSFMSDNLLKKNLDNVIFFVLQEAKPPAHNARGFGFSDKLKESLACLMDS